MRLFLVIFVIVFGSCVEMSTISNVPATPSPLASKDLILSTAIVDSFDITLVGRDGDCILIYSARQQNPRGGSTNEIPLGIASPCEFVRAPWKDFEPQSYSYQKGAKRRTVLLVTGGKPHSSVSDRFMPNGCGTALSKIRVFRDRIEVDSPPAVQKESIEEDSPTCPSRPVDEVFFAA
jgi:hypothetical protein